MKYLASDYDGTLYFGKGIGIKQEDIDAIQNFQKEGNQFGICSGRPLFGMKQNLKGIEADFYILNSGAHIVDKKGNTLYEKTIPYKNCCELIEYNPGFIMIFFTDQGIYMNVDMNHPMFKGIAAFKENPSLKVYSISVQCQDEQQASEITKEMNRYPGLDAYQNVSSVDAVSEGCSKEKGIQIYCELMGITDMACIGDSYNDIPMLESHHDSFTFPTSPQEVQDKASNIVYSIAQAIQFLMDEEDLDDVQKWVNQEKEMYKPNVLFHVNDNTYDLEEYTQMVNTLMYETHILNQKTTIQFKSDDWCGSRQEYTVLYKKTGKIEHTVTSHFQQFENGKVKEEWIWTI